jgi:hypothetical protein
MSKRIVTIAILQLLFAPLAVVCQASNGKDEWPCKTLPNLLLNDEGKPVWLSPDQLKKRAILKPEPVVPGNGCVWKDVIITVDVIVSEEGKVICAKFREGKGHPLYLSAAAMAAKKWTFNPIIDDGRPVAVCGQLKFFLKQNSGLGGSSRKPPLVIN